MKKSEQWILLLGILFLLFMAIGVYAYSKFSWRENRIYGVELQMNKSRAETFPFIYLFYGENTVDFDYLNPNKVRIYTDSSMIFKFDTPKAIRKLRLYIEKKVNNLSIQKIAFIGEEGFEEIDLKTLKSGSSLRILNTKDGKLEVTTSELNGYLETPKFYVYANDKKPILLVVVSVLMFFFLLFFLFKKMVLFQQIKLPNLPELSIILFVCSIFLPHPIFNITLILSSLLVIKNFNPKNFIANKINLIFIGLFFLLLINDLFIETSGYHNLKSTETYLPLLVLPIYISCIKTSKSLIYFSVSAITLGCLMFLTSIVDAVIFKNVSYFSFDEFAKYTHPVYYSYLASFSIFYIFLYSKLNKYYKNAMQGLLFFFLILAGSKLVIILTFLIYAALTIRNKKAAVIMSIGLIALTFFPPAQKRFSEILNINDLSVINEKVITDKNDPRVNGLTLRLLLWQESINTIKTIPEFIIGKGVGETTDELLRSNMVKRGLGKYQRFSTHNQFINIFMRAGFLGLFSLLMIIIYGFYKAIIKKNKMLLVMVIMFTFAMLTESVFQRVLGIYFFTTILLFLMKPNFLNENSNNRN